MTTADVEEAWASDQGRRASVCFPARMVPSLQEMSRFHIDTDTPNVPSWGLQTLRTQVLPEASDGLRPIRPAWLAAMRTGGGQAQGNQTVPSSWPKVIDSLENNGQWVQPWPEPEQRPGHFLALRPPPSWHAEAGAKEACTGR